MNYESLASKLRAIGMLSWAETTGLVIPHGHGVRDNPNVVTLGFCFFPLRPR